MKREIKFRGWLTELEEMIPYEQVIAPILLEPTGAQNEDGELVMGSLFRYFESSSLITWTDESSEFVALMQFTGLNDRNGKEIYEGDIIKWWSGRDKDGDHYDYRPIVFYQDGNNIRWCLGDIHNSFKDKEVEIAGNIHEHPELINKKS